MFSIEIMETDGVRAIKAHEKSRNLGIIAIDEGNTVDVVEFWEMCLSLYKHLTYQNDVNIKIKGLGTGIVRLKLRIDEDAIYKE